MCGLSYWSVVAALRDAFGVHTFLPVGGRYWLCSGLPLGAVTVIAALVFIVGRARPVTADSSSAS